MPWVILVLEDDANLREVLVESLEDCGCYQVHGASLPSEALQLAQTTRFDLVVSDVRMDEMDGITCLGKLRAQQPHLRSIVITGYASDDAPGRAIQAEAQDYLYKPITLAAFLTSVERVLEVEKERNVYDQLASAFNRGIKWLAQAAGVALSQTELASLEKDRNRAFQSFYVAVRSGLLPQSDALGFWDRLEQLENDREQLKTPGAHLKERQALGEGYRYVPELLAALNRSGQRLLATTRKPHQVTAQEFERLYKRLKVGELSGEQVKLAPFLRSLPAEERGQSAELEKLFEQAWGASTA